MEEIKYLVFYDGQCGLCDHMVLFILNNDKKNIFLFAPLQGIAATQFLQDLPKKYKQLDSLILIENFKSQNKKYYMMGKGALRILWLLGGKWSILGILSFLPSFFYDWAYRIVARNRHRFFKKDLCPLPNQQNKEKFLP